MQVITFRITNGHDLIETSLYARLQNSQPYSLTNVRSYGHDVFELCSKLVTSIGAAAPI
jgi:hypothetical protein